MLHTLTIYDYYITKIREKVKHGILNNSILE